jgi:hypothetical protein
MQQDLKGAICNIITDSKLIMNYEGAACLTENKLLCGWKLYLKYTYVNVKEQLSFDTETM